MQAEHHKAQGGPIAALANGSMTLKCRDHVFHELPGFCSADHQGAFCSPIRLHEVSVRQIGSLCKHNATRQERSSSVCYGPTRHFSFWVKMRIAGFPGIVSMSICQGTSLEASIPGVMERQGRRLHAKCANFWPRGAD
jgi:hypothetical protein